MLPLSLIHVPSIIQLRSMGSHSCPPGLSAEDVSLLRLSSMTKICRVDCKRKICGRWITCQGPPSTSCSTRIHRVVMTLRSSYRSFLRFLYTIGRRYKPALTSIRCCCLLLRARYRYPSLDSVFSKLY